MMKTEQRCFVDGLGWQPQSSSDFKDRAGLVVVFGGVSLLQDKRHFNEIKSLYPNAHIFGCSTSGEICGTRVLDDSLVTTAVVFEHSQLQAQKVKVDDYENIFQAGKKLACMFPGKDLKHVVVLSDGLINGSELVKGMIDGLPKEVGLTGALAGDGTRFKETLVFLDEPPRKGVVVAFGVYGNRISVSYASQGGWVPFGPERLITRAKGNILYELDGEPALDLYKKYLGDQAVELPSSAFNFPLSYRTEETDAGIVRTVVGIDEKQNGVIFAGDVSEGGFARLMKFNFERLVQAANDAARNCLDSERASSTELALVFSCVGRKIVMKQRVEEEVETIRAVLGEKATLAGFYSYGEISPFHHSGICRLHNQTMSITTFFEW